VRLKAGESFLGVDRLYPSPVWHDVDGDGLADVVVGDLSGLLTVARRQRSAGPAAFAAETKVLAENGEELDFANW
jgi:phytoene dehydrogenase-like protein